MLRIETVRWGVVGLPFGDLAKVANFPILRFYFEARFFWPPRRVDGLPRKGAEAWPARCGGDGRSPRKPTGPAFRLPRVARKARLPPHPKISCRRPIRAKKAPEGAFLFLFFNSLKHEPSYENTVVVVLPSFALNSAQHKRQIPTFSGHLG